MFATFAVTLISLVVFWGIFYKLLLIKKTRRPKLKATLIIVLFSALFIRLSYDIYAIAMRAIFSRNQQGQIPLVASPLRMPENQDISYCKRFTDQQGKVIDMVSVRNDGRYCGEFWRFKTDKPIFLPYKILNAKQTLYWASPSLQIIETKD